MEAEPPPGGCGAAAREAAAGDGAGRTTPKLRVAVEGCAHGRLAEIYEAVTKRGGADLLLICGDFQAVRNPQDLACMAVPQKYKEMGEFYKFYTGELRAPMLTLVIGGNHEASNYMQELFYGGWLAPNIYYLGQAGAVQVSGLRIAGLSGIYKERDYMRDYRRVERPPYNGGSLRSIYHLRPLQVAQLSLLTPDRVDIFLSHDWPLGIAHHGNTARLLAMKSFLRDEVMRNTLGSPPGAMLLNMLRPTRWFAAHMHVRFAATVRHTPATVATATLTPIAKAAPTATATAGSAPAEHTSWQSGTDPNDQMKGETIVLQPAARAGAIEATTSFLALDKCLPGRKYLEVFEVETPKELARHEDGALQLSYDPEWLGILELTQPFVVTPQNGPAMTLDRLKNLVAARGPELCAKWAAKDLTIHPSWFARTAPAYDPTQEHQRRNFRQARSPQQIGNPQTDRLLDMLGLQHVFPVTIPSKKVDPPPPRATAPAAPPPAAVADENEIDIDL